MAVAVHAATAGRYGYFRDELYFIACAHHLAWGYVDQPPLVAVAAWLAAPFGYALVALRALPLLASALTVTCAVALARELGGGSFARWTAGIFTLLLPAYLLLGNTLTTTSFEPLTWALAVYCTVRLVRSNGAWRWWIALSFVFAFGLYGKYSIALLAFALIAGLLATPERRVLRSLGFPVAVAICAALVAPNLAWQASHGWPIVEVLRGDAEHRPPFQSGVALEHRALLQNALSFVVEQILYAGPLSAPLWIAGIVAPFRIERLRDVRFVAVAALLAFASALALGAKGYYVVGIYASLLAVGCVWLESLAPRARSIYAAAAIVAALVAMPLALPVLSVRGLIAYSRAFHIPGNNGTTPHLVQPLFAEEFGWDRLARDVARVYRALPPHVRVQTALYADTYADAGALDFFGPRYGLPPAISSQNAYYLWGTHGETGRTLIAVGATRIDRLKRYYRRVRLVSTSFDPYRWIVEGPAPIYLCVDPVAPLSVIWPHLRWYGA
ncbi:MAG TPA: glycosyltransferase family 39 protein [Candidatus Dormibacteraeota bacterium]|nr:glycosyltransferase family 39 protein [Candidatus Dormibacteraeota bacterium]